MNCQRNWVGFGVVLIAGAVGCADSSRTSGLVLPAGDAERGKAAFTRMRCYDCHEISGVDLPVGEEPDQVQVVLGGRVTKVKSYSDLVTSIINPSHRLPARYTESLVSQDGVSNMTNYNDVMTVSELIDLVAFLQKQYKVIQRSPEPDYPPYY